MNTSVDSHTRGYDELAPGDYYIDTTNTTLFEVIEYQLEGREPWQIAQILGITSDQVYFALDYLAQHRTEVEAAYRAARRAAAQHVLSAGVAYPGLVILVLARISRDTQFGGDRW